MLLILLLIFQVSCDWVEISQNSYKKEPPHRVTPQPINNRYVENPKDNRIYRNNSAIEKEWNKATIDRVTNIGDIRRVQELSVKTPSIKLRKNTNDYTKLNDNIDVSSKRDPERFLIHKPFHKEEISFKRTEDIHKELIAKPSDVELVKRAQVITNIHVNNRGKPSQNPLNHRKISNEDKIKNPNQGSEENKGYKEQGNRMHEIVSGPTTYQDSDLDDRDYNVRYFQRLPATGQNSPKHNVRIKSNSVNSTQVPKTTRIYSIFDKDSLKHLQKIGNFDEEEEDLRKSSMENDFKYSNTSIPAKPKFHLTNLGKIQIEHTDDSISTLDLPMLPNLKTFPSIDLDTNIPERSIINNYNKESKQKNEGVGDRFEEISNATKRDAMSGMWKLVQVVTDTIYKNTHRSFKSKVQYLEGLKATILSTIEDQFERAWPDDMEHRGSRRARSAQARGHVEFPSSESTLMTISFLTFAVFLIKLVLQVIHAYKSKTMMVTPAVVAAVGRAAAALRSQH